MAGYCMSGQSIFMSQRRLKILPTSAISCHITLSAMEWYVYSILDISMHAYILYGVLPLEAACDTHALLYTQHLPGLSSCVDAYE